MKPLDNQQIAMPTVEVYMAIEEQILINIAKALKKHNGLITEDNINDWRTRALLDLGMLTRRNVLDIAKLSDKAFDEVVKALKTVGYTVSNEVDTVTKLAISAGATLTPPIASNGLLNMLSAYQSQAKDVFNMVNTTMLNQSQQIYIDTLNQVTGKVMSGTTTSQQALREVISKWAEDGVPALIDKSNRKWSAEAYVNMVVRSTINNVAKETQFMRMQENGIDLLEVSSHAGARPRCYPFQGRIYSLSGKHPKYPPFSSTSYGEAAGLFGVNCHHVSYPFIEGVSIPRAFEINSKENSRIYKESQRQRYLEREIRKKKRKLRVLEAIGDKEGTSIAKEQVKQKQTNMREFIKQTKRTRRYDREQIV